MTIHPAEPLTPQALEAAARRSLNPAVYDFFAGGADEEITVRANQTAFARIGLLPRVLRGVGSPDLRVTLLGRLASMPVFIAPTAFHRLAHPDGERATARAAATAETIMIVSMASTVAIEEVAAASSVMENGAGPKPPATLWFQLYIQPDLAFTETIVRRAEAAGCAALVVSVDSPVFGRRERDLRNGFFDLPPGMSCENMRDPRTGERRRIVLWPELSWEHIDWVKTITSLPVVLKGITRPEDARLAIEHHADAILVSNHGGRQLDTVPAAIELLSEIKEAVGGAVPLLLDGGIRRGTDVVKALALGANAVAIGRPVLWGLAVDGERGVADVLETLREDLSRTLALCGCATPSDLDPGLVRLGINAP